MKKIVILTLSLFILYGCADLNVKNPNQPETDRVLATAEDLKGVAAGAFISLYYPYTTYLGNVNLEWTADYVTMTNNVNGWWADFKVEPRPQYNNTLANASRFICTDPFKSFTRAISTANDVLKGLEQDGKQIGTNGSENEMIRAAMYFVRAMAYGYIATTYDKGYIFSYKTDLAKQPIQPLVSYTEIIKESLIAFDTTIAICNRGTGGKFPGGASTLISTFINTPAAMNATQFGKLANTYAAHFMIQNSRTAEENSKVDWKKVQGYAEKGITEDYNINIGEVAGWYNSFMVISGLDWYWRTDHRVIRYMDPSYPKRFPLDAASYPEAKSDDARLKLYFKYETGLSFFRAERGKQLRSHYRFARYDALYKANGIGTCPFMYAEVTPLMRAEAAIMQGDLSTAIQILNTGRRKTIGKLPDIPATATKQQLLDIVHGERNLELMLTDFALHFKDIRRQDALQVGTILHFPVPADELAILSQPFYTFGGALNVGKPGTASGSNSWLK